MPKYKLALVALVSALLFVLTACGGSGAGTADRGPTLASDPPPQPATLQQASVSPTGNPLVAQYSVTTTAGTGNVLVEFGPTTSYGFRTSSQPAPAGGGTVNILVAGMKQNSLYHMRAEVVSQGGSTMDQDRTFQTGTIPPSLIPNMHVTIPAGQQPSPGVELLSLRGDLPNQLESLAINPAGDIIWYYNFDPTSAIPDLTKLLPNGHMLMLLNTPDTPPNYIVREVDLAGNIVRQFDMGELSQKLHAAGYNLTLVSIDHDILLLPNGHLLFITVNTRVFNDLPGYPGPTMVAGNAVIDVDENNNPVWVWDAFDHLDVNRHPMNFTDWTHANALFYCADGNFLLSIRHQHWVVKIDYRDGNGSGDIVWKLGHEGDFALLGSHSPADWFYAQHDANIISANTTGHFQLAVFDNGDFRVLDESGDTCNGAPGGLPPCYTTAAIFDVNERTMVARRIWSYTSPYSFWGGVTQQLSNTNMFVDETAPSDLGLHSSRVLEMTQSTNPTLVWQLEIDNQNSYRTLHLPSLYPHVQW